MPLEQLAGLLAREPHRRIDAELRRYLLHGNAVPALGVGGPGDFRVGRRRHRHDLG
jgi:hypothetical protein